MQKDFDGWNAKKQKLDKRLVRKIGTVSKKAFDLLTEAVVGVVKTTDPARAGSSGAEANV